MSSSSYNQSPYEIQSAEDYDNKLKKLSIESEVLLANRPSNNLKISKNKYQLINLLNRHNQRFKVSADDVPKM